MTSFQTANVWTQIREAEEIPPKALVYFQARLKKRLHELVWVEFKKHGMTKAYLARRMHKAPEQVTRLLGAPGNWTLDTVSDLLLAIGCELTAEVKPFDEADSHAVTEGEWYMPNAQLKKLPLDAKTTSTAAVKELPRAVGF